MSSLPPEKNSDTQKVPSEIDSEAPTLELLDHVTDEVMSGDPLIGTKIEADRYEILSVIGFGGWSVVYKALDRSLTRLVAIKAMHPHLCVDQTKLMRFQREAQAASGLTHQNIAVVYDCGLLRAGRPYISMELVEGESLATIISEKKLPDLGRKLDIFRQMCDGLEAVHHGGLVHRDLKPSNIKVADSGVVKVLDFGCAKYILQEQNLLTKSDEAVGTPAYMSPEQCTGKSIDPRSDIYAVGCIMYETLTGSRPFASDNLLECMQMHLKTMPPAFRIACPENKIPQALESVVFKALSKDPIDRFASVKELREALAASAQPPSLLRDISEPWRRLGARRQRKAIFAAASGALIATAAGVACWHLMQTRSIAFPEGHDVGSIYLVERTDGRDGLRTRLGSAQGVVRVPLYSYVQLAEVPENDASALAFLRNMRPTDLQRIDLSGAVLKDVAVDNLNHIDQLDSVSFNRAQITDAALEKLRLSKLTGLNLSETHISDKSLFAIVENCPKLNWIALRGNAVVTDAGISSLAKMPNLSAFLFQEVRQITDACLAPLSRSRTMKMLVLRGDNITDLGLQSLIAAPALRRLDVSATKNHGQWPAIARQNAKISGVDSK